MVIPNECVLGCAYRDCTSDFHSEFCPCAAKPGGEVLADLSNRKIAAEKVLRFPPVAELRYEIPPEKAKIITWKITLPAEDVKGQKVFCGKCLPEEEIDGLPPLFEFYDRGVHYVIWASGKVEKLPWVLPYEPEAVSNRAYTIINALQSIIRQQAKKIDALTECPPRQGPDDDLHSEHIYQQLRRTGGLLNLPERLAELTVRNVGEPSRETGNSTLRVYHGPKVIEHPDLFPDERKVTLILD